MVTVLLTFEDAGFRHSFLAEWTSGRGRVVAEFMRNDNTSVSIVELGGSLRSVSRRIARHGHARAVPLDTIQQGFDLARKMMETSYRLTSCARCRSENW